MKSFTNVSIALAMTVGFASVAVAGDAKAPAAKAPAKEAPKMEMPKPAPELTEMSKSMVGTWRCTGKAVMDPTKPTEMTDMKMTMKFASDKSLGGWWITGTMDSPMFKGTMYLTYDIPSKKFYSMMLDNWGGSQTMWGTGTKDKMIWEGEGRSSMPGMEKMKVRETHDSSDPKAGHKMVGEMSFDGKTWMKGYEATCRK